jgi:hypothetical protein
MNEENKYVNLQCQRKDVTTTIATPHSQGENATLCTFRSENFTN